MIGTPPSATRNATIVLIALFIALVWPAILWGYNSTSEAYDQDNYHWPVIQKMAEQFPHVDVVNYKSATTPGYHLLIAVIVKFLTADERMLRLISSMFGLGLLMVVMALASRRSGGWTAQALTAPLLCSSYILSGSIWLTTDNAAWMFVALALGGAAMVQATSSRILAGSIFSTLAVLVRQIHIWVAAPVGLAGLWQWRETPRDRAHLMVAMATLAVPFAALAWFVWRWHGLVPPGSVEVLKFHAKGANFAVIPMTMALFGVFGVFFLPCFGPIDFRRMITNPWIWAAAAAGLIVSIAVPTSYSMDAGRWGGAIWLPVQKLPNIADRSIVFPPLAMLGMVILAHGWQCASRAGRAREASILLFGVLCWLTAQSMNSQAWQRYCEPMVLITLAWLASLASSPVDQPHRPPRRLWLGPALLAALQLLMCFRTLYFSILTGKTPLP